MSSRKKASPKHDTADNRYRVHRFSLPGKFHLAWHDMTDFALNI